MRLGVSLAYSGPTMPDIGALAADVDAMGYDSLWAGEAWGSDVVTVLGYCAAVTSDVALGTGILQMPARSPAVTAMTALTLDALSGGRTILGLGLSGPQVVEGWHGVSYGRPLTRTREYVDIVRAAIAREEPLMYDGDIYRIPYDEPDAVGLGKPLKSILHPVRDEIPVYLAAIGPQNTRLAGEVADGWLPAFYSPEHESALTAPFDEGVEAAGRTHADIDIAVTVTVVMGEDLDACRDAVRPLLALYIGGMGARERNFYVDLACRYGYEEAAGHIQDAYLEGRQAEAIAAVPDGLVDEVALVGPEARIRERLEVWKESRVKHLILAPEIPGRLPTRDALEVARAAL